MAQVHVAVGIYQVCVFQVVTNLAVSDNNSSGFTVIDEKSLKVEFFELV
jgi:hypothetical protein